MKVNKLIVLFIFFVVVSCTPFRSRIIYSGIYSHNTPLYYNSHNGFIYNPIIIHTPYRRPQSRHTPPPRNFSKRRYGKR